MIVTRRLPLSDIDIISEVMQELTELTKVDKLDAIGHFLCCDKEAPEDVTNEDLYSVRFIGKIVNE